MALARTLLTLISTATLLTVSAQTIGDTTIALVVVQANYAQQFPGGDLVDRFGTNSNIGLGAFRKFSNNYTLGGEGSFMFGNKVVEPGILRNVINSAGQIVNNTGEQANVFLYERGWSAFATVGRIFPLFGPNPNSGLHLKLGGGYLRHKVRVQTQKNVVPQLEDEYLEGYDRLSAGPAALAYLGYQHLSNKGASTSISDWSSWQASPRRCGLTISIPSNTIHRTAWTYSVGSVRGGAFRSTRSWTPVSTTTDGLPHSIGHRVVPCRDQAGRTIHAQGQALGGWAQGTLGSVGREGQCIARLPLDPLRQRR
ncbi:MAG: hypothetical protein IPF64_16525 [Flavobacteriales bacterium]|nr:hypothetical protein [Flavobacteriales bacterium]